MSEAADNPFNFCVRLIKISISYLIPVVSAGFFVRFSWRGYSSSTKAPHRLQVSVSGSRPHSGKLLSDNVFLLFLLTERTASFYERCLYPVRLAVGPVFSSRVARISFSILPSRSSRLRVISLVWLLLCLRCFLYVRLAFCTSRNFVRGR